MGAVLSHRNVGLLDAMTIGRYAMTIGATDPAHYDAAAARSPGAPMSWPRQPVTAIVEWASAPPTPTSSPMELRTTVRTPR